jgi:uncharacterized phiE125 gp8 family phage protein
MSGGSGTGTKAIGPAGSGGIVVAPAEEPVSLLEIKQHLRLDVDETIEDDLLTRKIVTARKHVEEITRRQLITATWDMFLDCWPDKPFIKLPFGNLQSVTSVKYKDANGVETTMVVNADYLVETNGEQAGRILLPYGQYWPSVVFYPSHPISIRFICGYGSTAASVDDGIRDAILMYAAALWTYREATMDKETYEYKAVMNLLWPKRLW